MPSIRSSLRLALSSLLVVVPCSVACSSSSSNNSADGGDDGSFDGDFDGGGGEDVQVIGPLEASALDEAGASSTCKALTSYSKCNTTDTCAPLLKKDCYQIDALYNLAGRKAFTSCYGDSSACDADSGTTINGCLFAAAALQTPDKAQNKLASDFCAACTGDSDCMSNFYSDITTEAGVVGLGAVLNLSLIGDATIEAIDAQCIPELSGVADCGDTFAECAETAIDPAQCTPTSPSGGDGGADGGTDPGGA